jgi:hypothetical protein
MEPTLHSASVVSRRRFFQTTALAAAAGGSLAWPAGGVAWAGDEHRRAEVPPKPIPGGIQIPGGPQIHVWSPGDPSVTLPFSGTTPMGFDVEPSTIGDFRGFSAVAFHVGTATGGDGTKYNLETDMRAFKGKYIGADGKRHFGSFAFI